MFITKNEDSTKRYIVPDWAMDIYWNAEGLLTLDIILNIKEWDTCSKEDDYKGDSDAECMRGQLVAEYLKFDTEKQ